MEGSGGVDAHLHRSCAVAETGPNHVGDGARELIDVTVDRRGKRSHIGGEPGRGRRLKDSRNVRARVVLAEWLHQDFEMCFGHGRRVPMAPEWA